jgi:DNA-binding MarR family transcriptional regulator
MQDQTDLFRFFNEIGIIEQLSRALLESRLPDGLIAPHFTVLNHLTRLGDGRTPVEIARAFQVPKTSMTHTLAGLERRGLVEMRPNPDDGRSKRVWLTAAGRALRLQVIAALEPEFARLRAGIDTDRLSAVLPALAELRAFLDADRDRETRTRPAPESALGPADFV